MQQPGPDHAWIVTRHIGNQQCSRLAPVEHSRESAIFQLRQRSAHGIHDVDRLAGGQRPRTDALQFVQPDAGHRQLDETRCATGDQAQDPRIARQSSHERGELLARVDAGGIGHRMRAKDDLEWRAAGRKVRGHVPWRHDDETRHDPLSKNIQRAQRHCPGRLADTDKVPLARRLRGGALGLQAFADAAAAVDRGDGGLEHLEQ